MSSRIFQKQLTDLDIAMFCFPKSQPTDPYNCALVSLQLLRLITPVKSNALIPKYHLHGVPPHELVNFIHVTYGYDVEYVDAGAENIHDYIFPGFATLIQLNRLDPAHPISHSVIYAKSDTGIPYLIDPQTGKIYSRIQTTSPTVKPLQDFIARHRINNVRYLTYKSEPMPYETHLANSIRMDAILASVSFETFFKRGKLVEESVLIPSSEIEMTEGGRIRHRVKRNKKYTMKSNKSKKSKKSK